MTLRLDVDTGELAGELAALAAFSEPAQCEPAITGGIRDTAVTRVVFSAEDLAARAWLAERARTAGLSVRTDAVGNTFFRWQGSAAGLAAVATGSHIDAIPNAGMYDGTVGVLGGLAAIRALKAAGFQPVRSLELILFTSEEPTRFGIGCLGSRLLAGVLDAATADALIDLRGRDADTLATVRARAGFPGDLAGVRLAPGDYSAFVELHIEQGPVLEREGLALGLVTHIAAPASGTIAVIGEGGHAGALPMPERRDALAAAAELVLAVEAAARATGSDDTVATVGMCEVFPGAVNSVPSRVRLSLDVRDIDLHRRNGVLAAVDGACTDVAARRGVRTETVLRNADEPAVCDAAVLAALERACGEAESSCRTMVSRAYHDSLFMARVCPAAMIFVPCRGGVSHRPDEYAEPSAIATGVACLARTLATLSLRTDT